MKLPWKEIVISAMFTVLGAILGWGISQYQYNKQTENTLKLRRYSEIQAVLKEINDNLDIGILDTEVSISYGVSSVPGLINLDFKAVEKFYLDLPELFLNTDSLLTVKVRSLRKKIYRCNRHVNLYNNLASEKVTGSKKSFGRLWEQHERFVKEKLQFSLDFYTENVEPPLKELKQYLQNNLQRLVNFRRSIGK